MAKKKRTQTQILQDDLNELAKDGLLKNPSKSLLAKLEKRISLISKKIYEKISKTDSLLLTRNLRKSYKQHFNNLVLTHKGLKQYTLEALRPKLRTLYKQRVINNLALIKSQKIQDVEKLKSRYLTWINLQSTGGSKETLKEMVKLPKTKRMKFVIRDQSNKLTSAMDEVIADHYDWIALQWKTRDDDKVVGKPGGKNEKVTNSNMHGNHWARRDKFFYRKDLKLAIKKQLNLSYFAGDTNFKDGMPGNPIGCRCYAVFYYELEDLPKHLVKNT